MPINGKHFVVNYIRAPDIESAQRLVNMINTHNAVNTELHTIVGKKDVYVIKVDKYVPVCQAVLLSCIKFTSCEIVKEKDL